MNEEKVLSLLEEMINEAEKKDSSAVLELNKEIDGSLDIDPLSSLYLEIDNIRVSCISSIGILKEDNKSLVRDARTRLYRIKNRIIAICPSCKKETNFYPLGSLTKNNKEIPGMQLYDCGSCGTTLSLNYLTKRRALR